MRLLAGALTFSLLAMSMSSLALAESAKEPLEESLNRIERDIAQFNVSDLDFELLEKILAAHPNDCYAHFLLCRCFERKGLMDMADEQLSLVHKLETRPEDILRRLRHHIEAGELSEAFTMQPIALEKSPNDPSLLLLHAIFLQTNGVTGTAESILAALLKRQDCPLGAATALASIRLDKKRYLEAIELADRDIKLNPSYLSAAIARGQALMALSRVDEVIATLKQPLSEHPFSRRLNLLMYEAYRHKGDLENELHCALRNLACSDYISYFEDAQSRVKELLQKIPASRANQIIKQESEVIARTTYAMKFHFFLGQVYFKLGKGKEAREELQTAMNLDPAFQPNWYEMGRIKEVYFGDFQGAASDFKKARLLQRSDYKSSIAFMRATNRIRNERRDLALIIKNLLRRPS